MEPCWDPSLDITVRDNVVLFWGGPFSQWHMAGFEIGGIKYNCAEQYMMAEKARTFGDHGRLEKILASDSPKGQKEHGRRVSNFHAGKWDSVCREVVFLGNLAKFTQNEGFCTILMKTGDMVIAEASPYDAIWGIGMGKDDPRASDPNRWLGTNWLGEAIMRVRKAIREESSKE